MVRQQAEAGIDVVSDGEFSKGLNWAFYIFKRLKGIAVRAATPEELKDPMASMSGGRDREAFPEFYAEHDIATGLGKRLGNRVVVNGPLSYVGADQVGRDISNIKAAIAKAKQQYPALAGFLPVAAPASALSGADRVLQGRGSLPVRGRRRLARGIQGCRRVGPVRADRRRVYRSCTTAWCRQCRSSRGWAHIRVDALNHALKGIPEESSRYHICWGSWNGPHAFDVPLKDIIDLLLQVRAGHYSFEAANPRHAHEWRVWETVKLPPGKVLIPGVISHATNIVEHPELVAERIVRLAKIVGRENVMGGTDCGFAQSPFARRVHPTIMWAKLKALAEGARIATRALWGKQAAA